MRRRVVCLTVTALLAALGVMLLWVGSLFEIMDLTTVFVVSLLSLFVLLELGAGWAVLLWAVTSTLSLLLLHNKFCALEYALFGGVYPLVKYYAERLPRLFAWIVKIAGFNLLFGAVIGLMIRFFGVEDLTLPVVGRLGTGAYIALAFVLGNLCFLIYDWLLTRFRPLYMERLHPRVSRFLDRR